jgi:hypothetical protein
VSPWFFVTPYEALSGVPLGGRFVFAEKKRRTTVFYNSAAKAAVYFLGHFAILVIPILAALFFGIN